MANLSLSRLTTASIRLNSFIADVNRARLPAFTLRTSGGEDSLEQEKSRVEVLKEDLDAAYRALPPHIAQRHKALEEVTKNMQTTMAGAMETRDGHLAEKLAMLHDAQIGAHRFLDGDEDSASRAGLAYLMGIFDKEQAAAISIQRAFRTFLSKRGPVDPNRPKPFKAKARYWEPIDHRPVREVKLTKEDMLKRSRVALLHAEVAVGKLEKQASESALSMVSRMRVPRAGASMQYRMDDRDYRVLLLGSEFVEQQEAEAAQWQEELAERKRLEAERLKMEELLERQRVNPFMEKVRKTMKSMAGCMQQFDSADFQEMRDSLMTKMLYGDGLALISAAIKEHSVTGDIKLVIQRFVAELRALVSAGKRISKASLAKLASGYMAGITGANGAAAGGRQDRRNGADTPQSEEGAQPLTEEDFMDVLKMFLVVGTVRDAKGPIKDRGSASFASRVARIPPSWIPSEGSYGSLTDPRQTHLAPSSPSSSQMSRKNGKVNSSFLSKTQRDLPWLSGDLDDTLLDYEEPLSPIGDGSSDGRSLKPSAIFSSKVERFATHRPSTSGSDQVEIDESVDDGRSLKPSAVFSSKVERFFNERPSSSGSGQVDSVLPLDEYSLKLLSMTMAAADAEMKGQVVKADELWTKTELLVASVKAAPSVGMKPVPLAFGSAAPRFGIKMTPSAPKTKATVSSIRSKLMNASSAALTNDSSEGSLIQRPPNTPPPLTTHASSPTISPSSRLLSPRSRMIRPSPLNVKSQMNNHLAAQASEPVLSSVALEDDPEGTAARNSSDSTIKVRPSSSPGSRTAQLKSPLDCNSSTSGSLGLSPLGISSYQQGSGEGNNAIGPVAGTSYSDQESGPPGPSMLAWSYVGDQLQGPDLWPRPSMDTSRGVGTTDSPSLNRRNSEAGILPSVMGRGNRISASSGGGINTMKMNQASSIMQTLQRSADIMNRLAGSVGGPTVDMSSSPPVVARSRMTSSTGGALVPSPRASSSGATRTRNDKPSIISQLVAQDKVTRLARLSDGSLGLK